ncbi:MAG: ABC transporter permease [Conexibacter sp.]
MSVAETIDAGAVEGVSRPPLGSALRRRASPLARYVCGRLAQGLFVVLGAVLISFLLVNLAGSPVDVMGADLNPQQRADLAHQLGYDRPLLARLGSYLAGALHGDLGTSYRTGRSALATVLEAFPDTALLIALAVGGSLLVTIPIAVYSVLHRESPVDRGVRRALIFIGAMPEYWLALLLVLLFAVGLGWLPSIGFDSPASLVLPTISIAAAIVPAFVRVLRASLLETARSDMVTSLRAKGFSDRHIFTHQGLKNSLIPFATLFGLQVGWLVGGTLIVEVVFAWPGVGFGLMDAVRARDLAVIQATVVLVACAYVVVNLLVDLFVMAIDPRVRLSGRRS